MRKFPGRFLEEIDEIADWPRLMHVLEVERIEHIETIALQQRQGLLGNDKISARQWEQIQEHEEWLAADGTESA